MERSNRYLVEAEINGAKKLFVIDTGAQRSVLAPDAADALNLPTDRKSAQKLNGVGDAMEPGYPRVVESITLGTAQWKDLRLPTTGANTFARFAEPQLAGFLGADILSRYDVELDFSAHKMTLYTAENCLGQFAPWHGAFESYSAEYTPRHLFLMDVKLNGHPAKAVLGTAASRSLLDRGAALRAGVDDATLARDPKTSGQGISGTSFAIYTHRFDTVQIGTRVFRNIHVAIADTGLSSGIDMLLGMDFMQRRRVWLSYSTGWVFMQVNAPQGSQRRPEDETLAASATTTTAPLDAAAQLQDVYASGVPLAGLPDGPIPQFSSHSHLTYTMVPHIVVAPRLSPQALAH